MSYLSDFHVIRYWSFTNSVCVSLTILNSDQCQSRSSQGVFPTEGFRLEVFLLVLTRHCVILAVFTVLLCGLKGRWYQRFTHERTFLRWFREIHVCPLVEWPLSSAYHVCRCGEIYMKKIYILSMIKVYKIWNQATMLNVWICAAG